MTVQEPGHRGVAQSLRYGLYQKKPGEPRLARVSVPGSTLLPVVVVVVPGVVVLRGAVDLWYHPVVWVRVPPTHCTRAHCSTGPLYPGSLLLF